MSKIRHCRLRYDNAHLYPVSIDDDGIPRFCGDIIDSQRGMNMIFIRKVDDYRDKDGNDESFVVYDNDVSSVILLAAPTGYVCCLEYDVEFTDGCDDE